MNKSTIPQILSQIFLHISQCQYRDSLNPTTFSVTFSIQ